MNIWISVDNQQEYVHIPAAIKAKRKAGHIAPDISDLSSPAQSSDDAPSSSNISLDTVLYFIVLLLCLLRAVV